MLLQTIMIQLISKYGYAGIFFLIAIENIFPPIPSEVILTFSGFMAYQADLSLLLMILFSTLGSIVGAIVLYFLGYILNKAFFQKFIDTKIGKFLHLSHEKIEKSIEEFQEKGFKSVFFCRLVPIMRSLISIPAGMCKMNFFLFFILTSIGSLIWNTILILLGNMVGENYYLVSDFLSKYDIPILIIILTLYFFLKKRKNKKIITLSF